MIEKTPIPTKVQDTGNMYFNAPSVCERAIEYNRLEASYFKKRGFKAEEITLHIQGYIQQDINRILAKEQRDVTVINVGVGQGKTYTAHKLIHEYAEKGYVVLVASPYTSLVERDFKALSNIENLKVINYKKLNDNTLKSHIAADIHVLTVNMLLKNPGKKGRRITQSLIKTDYLEGLQKRCAKENKKVVLFIDEIHESTHNFKQQFIKNLSPWEPFMNKVLILSATFSEASKLVIEQLAKLTNNQIVIYNCTRHKAKIRANLHLYLTSKPYSPSRIDQLLFIKEIVKDEQSKGRKVNILSGLKSLAKALIDAELDHPLSQYLSSLNFNCITADDQNVFDEERLNIGTRFGTGISINDAKSVLIIILPVVNDPSLDGIRGLFSNGDAAVIQAIARLRNGGDIHVVGLKPKVMIEGEYLEHFPEVLKPRSSTAPHVLYAEQPDIINRMFKEKFNNTIEVSRQSGIKLQSMNQPIWFDFVMEESQELLITASESFGRTLVPYFIWASFNNQFSNADLKSVTYIDTKVHKIDISSNAVKTDLKKLLSPSINKLVSNVSDKEALELLIKDIYKPNRTLSSLISSFLRQEQRNEIIYKGRTVDEVDIKRYPALMKEILNVLYILKHGQDENYDASTYFLHNIKLAVEYSRKTLKNRDRVTNLLIGAYIMIGQIRNHLVKHVTVESLAMAANNVITIEIEEKLYRALQVLKEWDPFIKNRTFSFLQNSNSNILRTRKEMIAVALVKLFFETQIVKVNGKRVKKITAVKPIDKPGLNLIF